MYHCKINPISGHNTISILKKGEAFLKSWLEGCPKNASKRPFIRLRWLNANLFIDHVGPHWKKKSMKDKAARYGVLPCVKELLDKSKDEPTLLEQTKDQIKWILEGLTPKGQHFQVIIAQFQDGKNAGEYFLNTAYLTNK